MKTTATMWDEFMLRLREAMDTAGPPRVPPIAFVRREPTHPVSPFQRGGR